MKTFYEARPERLFAGRMTRYPFPLHVHEVVEIAYVTEGGCTMQIDGETYALNAGDAAIAFPLVPHSFDRLSEGAKGFAAFLPADAIAEYASLFRNQLPETPVVRKEDVAEDFRLAVRRLMEMADQSESPLRLAYLHLLVSSLLQAMRFRPASLCHERGLAARVVRYIFDHACEDVTLRTAAEGLGISESHLSHLFAQQFHINFRRFINAIRIDKAMMLMRDPHLTLTQICDTCGYENMRTFRRAFTRETGELPAAYMRRVRRETVPSASNESAE